MVAASRARVSLLRYSPALILFAIVIADALQHSGADLWGHVLWGRELLAHGSLPHGNPYSYSAPGYPWLRHEWLSEVVMASMFDMFGPFGLKLLKFLCAAGTICFVVLAESETAAPAFVQAAILMVVALILAPLMQFRPQLFDFVALSAIIALLDPSQLAWFGVALDCDPDRRGLEQFSRWVFYRPRCARRLRGNYPPVRHPCGPRSAPRAWHYCDYRRRCRRYFVHVSNPARPRHLVLAHKRAPKPDDPQSGCGLETADSCNHDRR